MSIIVESPIVNDLCVALGQNEKSLNQIREYFRDWLKLQPHLPQDVPDEVLDHFIIGTKMSLESAKQKIDMFFTMKNLVPELFAIRDPQDPGLLHMHSMMQNIYLPKLTPENNRVCIIRPFVDDYSKLNVYDMVKYMLMIEEVMMMESRSLGVIYIADHSMLTLSLLTKFTPTAIKKCETTISEAYARRIRGIHFVNAAPLTETLVVVVKKVLKPKLAARVHVHVKGNLESLYHHVPKSILPKDYGGDGPSMDELSKFWLQKVNDKREWLIQQEKLVTDERLRPGPAFDSENLFGFSGSFRKLDVD